MEEEEEQENNNNISYENTKIRDKKFIEGNDKNIYYTQFNFTLFLFFIIFFVVCSVLAIGFFIIYLDGNSAFIYYTFIPISILILSSIIASLFPLFTKIIVDIPNELIIIKHFKILFLFNKTIYINLKEIEQIVIEKNTNIHYEINGIVYGGYNLNFKMSKDKTIKGLIGEIDKGFESQKLFEFLREAVPKNIPISSDLMEINELYPNLNSQRIVGSTEATYSKLNSSIPAPALSFE